MPASLAVNRMSGTHLVEVIPGTWFTKPSRSAATARGDVWTPGASVAAY